MSGRKAPAKKKATAYKRPPAPPRRLPWDEIRRDFVQGVEVEQEGAPPRRIWPLQSDLAHKYGIDDARISIQSRKPGPDGLTWAEAKEAFRKRWAQEQDRMMAEALAGAEVTFKVKAFKIANRLLDVAEKGLKGAVGPDAAVKFASTAKRAQEIGQVALDRPADGPAGENGDDWTVMRDARRARSGGEE